jgi:glycyl-tRNA synthetase beta chain
MELMTLATYLNEYPTVILGAFDPAYLALPDEILITVMRASKCAPGEKEWDTGSNFLAVINLDRDRAGLIRAGTSACCARFADAQFFGRQTEMSARRLSAQASSVTYQAKLGSYGDKLNASRAGPLARRAVVAEVPQASVSAADRSAELAKCDLVTDVVRSLPITGIVGGLYAKAQKT